VVLYQTSSQFRPLSNRLFSKNNREIIKNQISVNAVSAFFHDYIFVPQNKAKKTVRLLKQITKL
jgi:hypothetical protein